MHTDAAFNSSAFLVCLPGVTPAMLSGNLTQNLRKHSWTFSVEHKKYLGLNADLLYARQIAY